MYVQWVLFWNWHPFTFCQSCFDFGIHSWLTVCLSMAHTDSSDNSDLEDDIILALNEWATLGHLGLRDPDNASRLLSWRTRGEEKRIISAVGDTQTVGDRAEGERCLGERGSKHCTQLVGNHDCIWHSFMNQMGLTMSRNCKRDEVRKSFYFITFTAASSVNSDPLVLWDSSVTD